MRLTVIHYHNNGNSFSEIYVLNRIGYENGAYA